MVGVSAGEVHRKLERREDFVFLDVRSPREYEQVWLSHSMPIPLGPDACIEGFIADKCTGNVVGEPYLGKPDVRFDEGDQRTRLWPG